MNARMKDGSMLERDWRNHQRYCKECREGDTCPIGRVLLYVLFAFEERKKCAEGNKDHRLSESQG